MQKKQSIKPTCFFTFLRHGYNICQDFSLACLVCLLWVGLTVSNALGVQVKIVENATNDANGTLMGTVSLTQRMETATTNPLFANALQEGGVAYGNSILIPYNYADFPTYVLRSVPAGAVNQTDFASPGAVITTPTMMQDTFGYWTLDGVPQRDACGIALRGFSFTMQSVNRVAVAYMFTGDNDGDGLPDAWELFYFASLGQVATDDPDNDGLTLAAEYKAGLSPRMSNTSQEGGVSGAQSEMVTPHFAMNEVTDHTARVSVSVPEGCSTNIQVKVSAKMPEDIVVNVAVTSGDADVNVSVDLRWQSRQPTGTTAGGRMSVP